MGQKAIEGIEKLLETEKKKDKALRALSDAAAKIIKETNLMPSDVFDVIMRTAANTVINVTMAVHKAVEDPDEEFITFVRAVGFQCINEFTDAFAAMAEQAEEQLPEVQKAIDKNKEIQEFLKKHNKSMN